MKAITDQGDQDNVETGHRLRKIASFEAFKHPENEPALD
jgi:hypothetical protein